MPKAKSIINLSEIIRDNNIRDDNSDETVVKDENENASIKTYNILSFKRSSNAKS